MRNEQQNKIEDFEVHIWGENRKGVVYLCSEVEYVLMMFGVLQTNDRKVKEEVAAAVPLPVASFKKPKAD